MTIKYNNTNLFKFIGFPLNNNQWSWGAVDHELKQVVLRCWDVEFDNGNALLDDSTWVHNSLGAPERQEHLDFIKSGYELFIVKDKVKSTDRKWVIAKTKQFIMSTGELFTKGTQQYVEIGKRIELRTFNKG